MLHDQRSEDPQVQASHGRVESRSGPALLRLTHRGLEAAVEAVLEVATQWWVAPSLEAAVTGSPLVEPPAGGLRRTR